MGTLTCRCGHVISDVRGPRATEGELLGEQARAEVEAAFTALVDSYLRVAATGERAAWLQAHLGERYPLDLRDAEVVADLLTLAGQGHGRAVAECGRCGRLWIQVAPGEAGYRVYRPEEPSVPGTS